MYLLFIIGLILLGILTVPIFFGFGKVKGQSKQRGNAFILDKKFVQEKWSEIDHMVSIGGASQLKTAIMEGDKLVDYVLKSRVIGETMGERIKNAKSSFSDYTDYDNLWFAHKVRNNIAHETSHELGIGEARRATEYFKKALKELKAL